MLTRINQAINQVCDCKLTVRATTMITLAYAILIVFARLTVRRLGVAKVTSSRKKDNKKTVTALTATAHGNKFK